MSAERSFLDNPTVIEDELKLADDPQGLVGQQIGPYRVSDLLGSGGMGTVYLAEQRDPVHRIVALKLMQEALVGAIGRAYFEVECQALAKMQHPAIARFYDAGTTDGGRPYFVMERIDGDSLTVYCERLGLDLRQRLALFQRLCLGVQHVHQHGLIHRDLKPANVLVREVDGIPWPTLIDFGLAMSTRQDGSTKAARREGTEIYMSPEQARGNTSLDIRSDVYALGVMLLELLGGERFNAVASTDGSSSQWHLLLAQTGSTDSEERVALSANLRELPKGLRWVLARALAPKPEHRYPTAATLSEDIERWLAHRPVAAAPNRRTYKIALFMRRHRLPMAMGGLLLLALLGGLIGTSYALLQAQQALTRADREAAKAGQVAGFLGEILSSVEPNVARDLDKTLMRKVLDEAARRSQQELKDQPQVLAEIDYAIGRSYASLVDHELSLPYLRRAWGSSRDEHGALAPPSIKRLVSLVNATAEAGEVGQAREIAEVALRQLRAAGLEQRADVTLLRVAQATVVHQEQGAAKALEIFEEIAPLVRVQYPDGDSRRISFDIGLAVVLSQLERFSEAEAIYEALVEQRSRLDGIDHPRTLSARQALAIVALDQQQYDRAIELNQELVPEFERVFGKDNLVTLSLRSNLAGALRQGGRAEESEAHYRAAYEGTVIKLGRDHPRSVLTTHNYANYLLEVGQVEQAVELQYEALAGAAAALPGNAWVRSEILGGLGRSETAAQRWNEAEEHLLQALKDKESVLAADHARVIGSVRDLVELYQLWGAHPDQLAEFQQRVADSGDSD